MNKFGTTVFDSGFTIESEKICAVCNSVIETLKKELPEEAQSREVIDYVLEECSELLKGKQLKL